MVFRFAAPRAAFFTAATLFIHCGPGAALRLLLRRAAFLVALFDMLGFSLLLARIRRFVTLWHDAPPLKKDVNGFSNTRAVASTVPRHIVNHSVGNQDGWHSICTSRFLVTV